MLISRGYYQDNGSIEPINIYFRPDLVDLLFEEDKYQNVNPDTVYLEDFGYLKSRNFILLEKIKLNYL